MQLTQAEKVISGILTFIQYSLLLVFIYYTPLIASGLLLQIIEFLGVFLGFWAIFEMRKSKLRITPIPDASAVLITSGPYKIIRHPMYLAILLTFLPLTISNSDTTTLILFNAILISLFSKLNFEETLLKKHFSNWSEYARSTKKVIPFIY